MAPSGAEHSGRGPARDALACVLVALLACAALLNASSGGFVYDDRPLIVDNPLIRPGANVWTALTTHVWAARDGAADSSTNYWRPTFVAWLILHARLFGTDEPSSARWWRLSLIGLHGAAAGLCYLFARRLGLALPLAAGAAAVFATHPTNVESVAWLSSSPGVLATVGMLGAWLAIFPHRGRPTLTRWALAMGLFAFALGSKEVAVLFPAVVGVTAWPRAEDARGWLRVRRAAAVATPFAALSVAYLVARHEVLTGRQPVVPGGLGATEAALSAPLALAFYLRQAVWPADVSPLHQIGAITPSAAGWSTLWGPLLVVLVSIAAGFWLAKRCVAVRVGLAWAAAALAPVLIVTLFPPDEFVHDRYLYPALPGLVVIAAGALARLVRWTVGDRPLGPALAGVALTAAALCMTPLTRAYARAWCGDPSIWEWAVRARPTSATAVARQATCVAEFGDASRALELFERSIALGRTKLADAGRIGAFVQLGRTEEAVEALREAIGLYPPDPRLHEALCGLLERSRRHEELVAAAEAARAAFSAQRSMFTVALAAGLEGSGQTGRAIEELERVRDDASSSPDARVALGLVRLARLYAELGRPGEARVALAQYLEATAGRTDEATLRGRAEAQSRLRALQWR